MMKKTVILAFLLFSVCSSLSAQQKRVVTAIVTNPMRVDREDEPVVIKLKNKDRRFIARSAVVTYNDVEVPCQIDDLDGDGLPDELVFLSSVDKGASLEYTITFSDMEPQKKYAARSYADILLDDKRQRYPHLTAIEAPGKSDIFSDLYHHGVAFESDVTAYRIYFDRRQNIDIYGKRIKRLELADTHFYTTPQQLEEGYGNDVLWAGNAIGCGTLKLWDGERPNDWDEVTTRGQRIVTKGPIRSIVEVTDFGFNGGMNATTRYTLYAGHREVLIETTLNQPLPSAMFCTGVQKIGTDPYTLINPKEGICASWGMDFPEQSSQQMMLTYPPETVGLAVYVPKEYVMGFRETTLNCLFVIGKLKKPSFHYYAMFCARKEVGGFQSKDDWFSCLKDWKKNLEHPLKVKLTKMTTFPAG